VLEVGGKRSLKNKKQHLQYACHTQTLLTHCLKIIHEENYTQIIYTRTCKVYKVYFPFLTHKKKFDKARKRRKEAINFYIFYTAINNSPNVRTRTVENRAN
jgi:hypothetical protein